MSRYFLLLILCNSLVGIFKVEASVPQSSRPEVISIDSVALTAEHFWRAYTSSNEADQHAARFFLLGVMDATEGKSWCSYQQFKTISLRDYLNGYFRNLPETQMQLRAAIVIETALIGLNECKGNL